MLRKAIAWLLLWSAPLALASSPNIQLAQSAGNLLSLAAQFIPSGTSGTIGTNFTISFSSSYLACAQASSQIVGNATTSIDCQEYWNTGTWNNDQCAQATVHAMADANGVWQLNLRMATGGSTNTRYRLHVNGPVGATATWQIGKFVANTITNFGTATTVNTPADSTVIFCAIGTVLTAYLVTSSGWASKVTATDSSITSGNPGIGIDGNGGAQGDVQLSSWNAFNANY